MQGNNTTSILALQKTLKKISTRLLTRGITLWPCHLDRKIIRQPKSPSKLWSTFPFVIFSALGKHHKIMMKAFGL
jgi:hypothetical protein